MVLQQLLSEEAVETEVWLLVSGRPCRCLPSGLTLSRTFGSSCSGDALVYQLWCGPITWQSSCCGHGASPGTAHGQFLLLPANDDRDGFSHSPLYLAWFTSRATLSLLPAMYPRMGSLKTCNSGQLEVILWNHRGDGMLANLHEVHSEGLRGGDHGGDVVSPYVSLVCLTRSLLQHIDGIEDLLVHGIYLDFFL